MMASIDKLRELAHLGEEDDALVDDGVTYGDLRALLSSLDCLRRERDIARRQRQELRAALLKAEAPETKVNVGDFVIDHGVAHSAYTVVTVEYGSLVVDIEGIPPHGEGGSACIPLVVVDLLREYERNQSED